MTRVAGLGLLVLLVLGTRLAVHGAMGWAYLAGVTGVWVSVRGAWLVDPDRGWGTPGEASQPEGPPPPQGPSQTRTPNRDF